MRGAVRGGAKERQAAPAIDLWGAEAGSHLVEGREAIHPLGRVVVGLRRDLFGHRVLLQRMSMAGRVADLLVHPLTGRVESLLYRPEPTASSSSSTELLLHIDACGWDEEGALVISCPPIDQQPTSPTREQSTLRRGGPETSSVLAKDGLMGAQVVTREGHLLGSVAEIYFVPVVLQVLYHVVSSRWQRIFGRSLYLCGDLPYAYSQEAKRLFVPANVSAHSATALPAAVETLIARQSPALPSTDEKPTPVDRS